MENFDKFIKFKGGKPDWFALEKIGGSINRTEYDLTSITHYSSAQIPELVTLAGDEIPTPKVLSEKDIAATRRVYASEINSGGTPADRDFKDCLVVGVSQQTLLKKALTKTVCEAECERFADRIHRRCEWNGVVFRPHPTNMCLITTDKVKPSMVINIQECRDECAKYAASSPNRTCFWDKTDVK